MPVCEVDFRVGGRFRYVWRNEDGRDMGMGGDGEQDNGTGEGENADSPDDTGAEDPGGDQTDDLPDSPGNSATA